MATILYDAEVFPHNWMFGFKIVETQEYVQIWDDFDEIRKFIDENKSSFFIGFNSNFYDDVILETVLNKIHPYETSCDLIDRQIKKWNRLHLHRLDIVEGMRPGTSLSSIESELGMSIEESEVDFHIPRPLTEEEKESVNEYNRHDLDATERLVNHRWSNFIKTKVDLIKYFNLPSSMMRKPFATMVATGLGAKRSSHPPRKFKWYDNLIIKHPEVIDFVTNETFLDRSLEFTLAGVEHTMGLGGIHGAVPTSQYPYFWVIDVKGYYSLLQMNLDLLSRSLPPEGKQAYNDLYFERLRRKENNDPSADSLKAAILSVWGATLNEYQLLNDTPSGNLIMISGQVFLIDLIEKLEPYIDLIQSNTDGIFIVPHDEEKVREVVDEWVARTGFEVEIEKGEKLFQKDVNNYVCLIEGKEVAKGSYVNLWKMQDDKRFFEFRLTYNQSQGTVIDKAVVANLLYNTPVEETINNEMNPRSFMYTIKKGSKTYSHVEVHERRKDDKRVLKDIIATDSGIVTNLHTFSVKDKTTLAVIEQTVERMIELENEETSTEVIKVEKPLVFRSSYDLENYELEEWLVKPGDRVSKGQVIGRYSADQIRVTKVNNVNRIFVSKDDEVDRRIYKIKNGVPNLFPRLDTNIFVFNKDLSEFTEDDMNRIDKDYYITQAKNRILDFITPKPVKVKKIKEPVVRVKLLKNKDESKNTTLEDFTNEVLNLPNGVHRIGDASINKMGIWYTFIQKNGKTIIINSEKFSENTFKLSYGNLRKQRVSVEGKTKYFDVIETDFNALVNYVDKKNKDECFEFTVDSFEDAFVQLDELGLVEQEILDKVTPEERVVEKTTSGKTKETIRLDESNWITYETYDLGQGSETEVALFKDGAMIRREVHAEMSEVLDIVEKWVVEFGK